MDVSGGSWGGAVYDVDAILEVIAAGKKVMEEASRRDAFGGPGYIYEGE